MYGVPVWGRILEAEMHGGRIGVPRLIGAAGLFARVV